MFDTKSITKLESATLALVHPIDGGLIGAELTLASAGHPKRKALEFQHARMLRARVAKKGRFELTDPQDDEDYAVDRLVVCTLGWSGFARDGVPLSFTVEEARTIYTDSDWIRTQALAFLEDSANFLQSARPA